MQAIAHEYKKKDLPELGPPCISTISPRRKIADGCWELLKGRLFMGQMEARWAIGIAMGRILARPKEQEMNEIHTYIPDVVHQLQARMTFNRINFVLHRRLSKSTVVVGLPHPSSSCHTAQPTKHPGPKSALLGLIIAEESEFEFEMTPTMQITADEINCLIYSYLQDSGKHQWPSLCKG
jgi:hypothetical protein